MLMPARTSLSLALWCALAATACHAGSTDAPADPAAADGIASRQPTAPHAESARDRVNADDEPSADDAPTAPPEASAQDDEPPAPVDDAASRVLQGAAPRMIVGRWAFSAEATVARSPQAAVEHPDTWTLDIGALDADRVGELALVRSTPDGDTERSAARWRIADSDLGRGALTIAVEGARGAGVDALLGDGDVTLDLDAAGRLVAAPGPGTERGADIDGALVFLRTGSAEDIVGRWAIDMSRTRDDFDIRLQDGFRENVEIFYEFERIDAVGTGVLRSQVVDPREEFVQTLEGSWSVESADYDANTMVIMLHGRRRTGPSSNRRLAGLHDISWDENGVMTMHSHGRTDSPLYFERDDGATADGRR